METKYDHASIRLHERNNKIMGLFFDYVQLKNIYRRGWLKKGISKLHCESDADHSFGVALLGFIIAQEYRPDLDSEKVMLLGLFHELGEIDIGDYTPDDNISHEDKFLKEYECVKRVFSRMSNYEKYVSIWLEFEKEETPEAKFVKQIDSLELAFQANLYEMINHTDLEEFFTYALKRINSPELKIIMNDILKAR